ncbi:MAG: C39 family peptidase [Chloroflexota bacterium]|jgi:hypothetical protein
MSYNSWRNFIRYCILFVSILLLAAGLIWQTRISGHWEDVRSSIAEAEPSSAAQPTPTGELPAALPSTLPSGASVAVTPTLQQDSRPLWVTLLRDVRLIGGLQRQDESVPKGTVLRVLAYNNDGQLLVHYAGDNIDHEAAEGLVDSADVAPIGAPKWLMVRRVTALRSTRDPASGIVSWLQPGVVLETLDDGGQSVRVYYLGNGREREPAEGWVDVENLVAAGPVLAAESRGARWLDKERVGCLLSGDGVWIQLPYRTQLDGSPAATANCGPASIGMILEYLGVASTNAELRSVAHRLQGTSGDDTGFAIEYLQSAVELLGMRGYDLYSGSDLKKWSLDDLRRHILDGRPVVPQLRFHMMPGRDSSDYWEDHYVVLCGVQGEDFIYSDPTDIDGPGYGRLISAKQLEQAWSTSYCPFAAFAVGRQGW